MESSVLEAFSVAEFLNRMPIVTPSSYRAPYYALGAHGQTIFPNLTRRRWKIEYDRERFELADGDFVDIDWSGPREGGGRLVLILHGLEGSSRAPYAVCMARAARKAGCTVGVLNFRGCSGELNRLPRFYHSGDTGDLRAVLERLAGEFESISLVGFSLGGNVLLKYMGEDASNIPEAVRSAVAFSVPCDLAGSALALERFDNAIYMKRFIKLLCAKVAEKEERSGKRLADCRCREMRTFRDFDGTYTAPLHGFRDADDYWTKSSSGQFLAGIDRPTLLVSALNDPFLSESCFPREAAEASESFFLETPRSGGHCSFPGKCGALGYWYEERALEFIETGR